MEATFQQQASLWGQAFEVFVKRGVLSCLIDHGIASEDHPVVREWQGAKLGAVYSGLVANLHILDETVIERTRLAAQHLAVVGWGIGNTAMREYMRRLKAPLERKQLTLRALWCPLTLPGPRDRQAEKGRAREAFAREFGLPGPPDVSWTDRGQPANADFILWLSGAHPADHLLVQEYSYDAPAQLADFRDEEAHLDELIRYRRLVDSRGVFARVTAEVDEERFELSDDIKTHLTALTADNKPFFKLCQGAAYAEATVRLLAQAGLLTKPCLARSLAITSNGLESLAARVVPGNALDPRYALMQQLGEAYRHARKVPEGDEAGLTAEIGAVFNGLLRRLPTPLYLGLKPMRTMPQPGEDFALEFEETAPVFSNPMQTTSREDALAMVDESAELAEYFGMPARTAIARVLDTVCPGAGPVSLRNLHAAAVVAGLSAAKTGKLNVLALEGNPGIGKTTAVVSHLSKQKAGYLFLYVSPRVVINRDVTEKLARKDGAPTGILTVTTNAQLIAAAERWHLAQVSAGKDTRRYIDGAVVADGVADMRKPEGSVLVLTPEQEREIEAAHAGSRLGKMTLSENEDLVVERSLLGVLAGMSTTARELLALNPRVQRTVLTAALQGFREKGGGKTTMDALSKLFRSKANCLAGLNERRVFAQRMPTIVVMVDELAGDGAGAPFVHAVANWLKAEFLEPFDGGGGSPFTVALVVSDASLGNELVLERYLSAGDRTPDKVLVSKSPGERCFRIAATKVKVGIGRQNTLHVMTNSFPASKLDIEYRVSMSSIRAEEHKTTGALETTRQAIRRVAEETLLDNAEREIVRAILAGASQVIYFAQDKQFLRALKGCLAKNGEAGLAPNDIQILDSSVPGWRRKQLVEEKLRDTIKVFLMTSSGARGVSFPKTDWIIASVPRFNVEAALMEIAQLIYRGRGMYHDAVTGEEVSGDSVPRRLVMLVNDFLVYDEALDQRQWLRQSTDILTLLSMLRATIYTRITGDAGMKRQRLALVPVGAVGLEELMSLMSQYVVDFISEADTFMKEGGDKELTALAVSARNSASELFSRFRLHATAKQGKDGFSFVRQQDAAEFVQQVSSAIAPLVSGQDGRPSLSAHIYCAGPVFIENWADFDKREVFSFEGWETQAEKMTRALYMQLRDIDAERRFPSALRIPASNLLRLLARDKPGAANEFSTLKELKSPNTWVVVPVAYPQFMAPEREQDGRAHHVNEPEAWRQGLGRVLSTNDSVMPPIPRYHEFPWVAGVGHANPLRLDIVFDDRYFMASNELNLLNTILLAEQELASDAPKI
jgi:hypothetical protein